MSRRFVSLALSACVLAAAPSARAATITYADRTSFLAAAGAVSTIDFEGVAADGGFEQFLPPAGFTSHGVTFNVGGADGGDLFVLGAGYYYSTAVLSFQQSPAGGERLLVTLPGPTTAFGADLGAFIGSDWVFSLSNGDVLSGPAPDFDGLAFFGFTSTTPFASLVITSNAGVDSLDNVAVGSPILSSVPEPASFLLLTTGLAAALARRRRGTRPAADHRS